METLWKNLTYSVRMLLKRPSLTIVAIIAMALGIGANTAIFSVVNTVLLRALPFEQPEQLVAVAAEIRGQVLDGRGSFSVPDLLDVQSRATTLDSVAAVQRSGAMVTEGEPERLIGAVVTADYFQVFRVKPILGRVFTRDEDKPGGPSVIVISYGLWQRRFGGDRNIIGREVNLGGKTTVIGVLPAGFEFPITDESQDYWEPMMSAAFLTKENREARDNRFLTVVGRMKPGVTIEQTKADLDLLSKQIEQQFPVANTNIIFNAVSMHEDVTRDYRPALLVMFGAVGLVLLIACANVANLLLARVAARQKEVAIRTALGASRGRIATQFLIESLLLSFAGGAIGLLLATWGVSLLIAYSPADVPRLHDVKLDATVLAFTFGATVLTGVLFGLAPALQAARPNPNHMLKDSGRGPSQSGRSRMRSALIVSEVALSLMLLVGAALLINSFVRLLKTNAGFDKRGVLALDIPLSRTKFPKPEQQAAQFQQLLERMKSVPGARDVALTSNVPLTPFDVQLSFNIQGRPPYKLGDPLFADYTVVSADYFRAMNIPLHQGRVFTNSDTKGTLEVLVVTDAFVRHYFPGEDPIGRRVIFDGSDATPREIVGVVGDVRRDGLDVDVQPEMYASYLQSPERRLNVILKTDLADAGQLIQPARAAVKAFDRDQIIWRTQTLDQLLSASVAPRRFNMLLLGIFSAVALVLAAVGLYGVMSYSVSWRTHEIGIRMALGAKRANVLRLVVRQGMTMAFIGLAIGLVGAFSLSRVLKSLLYGVSSTDPLTFAIVSVVLLTVALLACLLPARRATRVDPLVALRTE